MDYLRRHNLRPIQKEWGLALNSRKILNKAILGVVEKQLRNLNPPATKETFDRLIATGLADDEARRLIGCVVASEIFDILDAGEPYNEGRYVQALRTSGIAGVGRVVKAY